jgi:hypothetical protein
MKTRRTSLPQAVDYAIKCSGTTGGWQRLRTARVRRLGLLLPLLLTLPISVHAQFNYTTDNGTITIKTYTGPGGEVTIPDNINGLPVTSIWDWAFYDCTNLTNVTIPNSVINIGDRAFEGCTSLTSVTIPNSVINIWDGTFRNCRSLTSVTIGNSVTSIGSYGFFGCSSLTNLTIPNSVTTIGDSAFAGCSSLTNLTIPNSVTGIGYGAFEGCGSLTIVTIPKPQLDAHPLVKEMLRDIQPTNLYCLMRQITGEEPVFVGNEVVGFYNRLTGSAPFRKATQFACEQLQALGLYVQYQDWETAWGSGPTYSDRNIIGIQPGISQPEEIVVICAHLDDWSGPGADDNGSGSAAVLTAARICSQYRFERTIHYVLFTGEEQHGLGSQEYVAQAVAGGSNIVAVLAPDMIGYASSLKPPTCELIIPYPRDLGLEGAIGSEVEAMFTVGFEIQATFTNVVAMYGLSNTVS